jgi:hypothetical protein
MERFHFHIRRAALVVDDPEGVEMPGLAAAHQEAVASIRSILADELLSGSIDLSGCVVITDEADSPVLTVPFAEAVEVTGVSH